MSEPFDALYVRCSRRDCRTMIDLANDPSSLCDECGEVTCDGCEHLNCEGRIVTGRPVAQPTLDGGDEPQGVQ